MPSPEDIGAAARDAAEEYGAEQFDAGAASRQSAIDQAAADLAAETAYATHLEDQLAAYANEPPSGYKVPNAVDDIAKMLPNTQVFIPAGKDWPLAKKFPVADGFDILMAKDAVLTKTWDADNSTQGAMFANARYDMHNAVKGFRLRGGTIKVAPGMGGSIFAPYASGIEMRDVHIDGWTGGKLWGGGAPDASAVFDRITWACVPYDYADPRGVGQPSGSGCAGWRWMCGGGLMTNSGGWSGDDGLQLVLSGAKGDAFFDGPDIDGFWYVDCWGNSYTARPLVAGMQTGNKLKDGDTSAGMTAAIRNSGWRRCTGHTSGSCVNIANHHGQGPIEGLVAEECEIWQDNLLGAHGQPGEVNVITYAALPGMAPLGAVRDIRLDVKIHSPRVPKPKKLVNASGPLGDGIDTTGVLLLPAA